MKSKFVVICAFTCGPTALSAVHCGDLGDIFLHNIAISRTDKWYLVNRRNDMKIESAVIDQTPPCSTPHPHNKHHHFYGTSNSSQCKR
jgi:hypothetical protein